MKIRIPILNIYIHLIFLLGESGRFNGLSFSINGKENYSRHYLFGQRGYFNTRKSVLEYETRKQHDTL